MTIRIRRRKTDALPEQGPHGLRLQAETTYIVEGPGTAAVVRALPSRVVDVLSDQLALVCFGNAVGRVDGGPLGTLDVYSGKLDADGFDRLLNDVARRAAALPFSAGTPTQSGFSRRMTERPPVYHAFAFLRASMAPDAPDDQALLPALRHILAQPHVRFVRSRHEVGVGAACRVDVTAMLDVVAGRWPLERARLQGPVARRLGGRLPQLVEETTAVRTIDTPENRFALHMLGLVIDLLDEVIRAAAASRRPSVVAEARGLMALLEPVRSHRMWSEVGRMAQIPAGSTVLHGRAAYRTLFVLHSLLMLGARLPLDDDAVDGLLEVKDVARLYELWCCFEVMDAVRSVLGAPSHVGAVRRGRLSVEVGEDDYAATWPDGTTVVYNPRFKRSGKVGRQSYSVPLRPDIGLWVPNPDGELDLHLFDAKFKVDWTRGLEAEDDRKGKAKRADLYKMHTYRDALGARSVWALYPGTERRFYSATHGSLVDGVGALPLRPGGLADGLEALLRRQLKWPPGSSVPAQSAVPRSSSGVSS
jgi:predicted component of viral defense system (DUF524 family)